MKTLRTCTVPIALLLALLGHSQAQAKMSQKPFQIGIGASIGAEFGGSSFLPISLTNFYVPMIISGKVKIEPEFGYLHMGASDTNSETNSHLFRLGIGGGYMSMVGQTGLTMGLRLGLVVAASNYESNGQSGDNSRTDFYIGPFIGAEHFLAANFSLGAELQFNYYRVGEDEDDPDERADLVSTRTQVFARFYF